MSTVAPLSAPIGTTEISFNVALLTRLNDSSDSMLRPLTCTTSPAAIVRASATDRPTDALNGTPLFASRITSAAAVQSALQGYSGTMGGESGVSVGNVIYADETDLYEENTKLFHVALDFILWHKEA